jgi:hypothetical protein
LVATVRRFELPQGSTYRFSVVVNGIDLSLAGGAARFQLREKHTSAAATVSLTSTPAAGLTITYDAGEDKSTISGVITAAVTAGLRAPWTYVGDMEIVIPGSLDVARVLEGVWVTSPEATK